MLLKGSKRHNAYNLFGEFITVVSLWALIYYMDYSKITYMMFFALISAAALSVLFFLIFAIRFLKGMKKSKSVSDPVSPAETEMQIQDRIPGDKENYLTEDRMPGAKMSSGSGDSQKSASTAKAGPTESLTLAGSVPRQNLNRSAVVATLKKIIDDRGIEVLNKPAIALGLFGDYEPTLINEKRLLKACFDSEIASDFVKNINQSGQKKEIILKKSIEKLTGTYFLDSAIAEEITGWICESIGW